MGRKTKPFELQEEDAIFLETFTESGISQVRELKRALALLMLKDGLSINQASKDLGLSIGTLYTLRKKYRVGGLKNALYDKPRSGRPPEIFGKDKAKITALACSEAPPGRVKWTLRLLADRAVELGFVEKGNISHTGIRYILKKTN